MKNLPVLSIIVLLLWTDVVDGAPRILFVPNEGQLPDGVRYSGIYGNILLMDGGIRAGDLLITFVGASPGAVPKGKELSSARINHFRGRDPGAWVRGLPAYSEVIYRGLYPGVDLLVRGMDGSVSLQWIVHPGGDVSSIRLEVQGSSEASSVLLKEVRAYQGTEEVDIEYVVQGDLIRFRVGEYDRNLPLIIDPVIALGSARYNAAVVEVDEGGGYLYVLLRDSEVDTLRVGGLVGEPRGSNAVIILKVDPSLSSVVAGAVLDGSSSDVPTALGVAPGGVYVAGYTYSSDFPMVSGGFDPTLSGAEGFLMLLSQDLSSIVSGTFVGGSGSDFVEDMVVSSDGVYLTGYTYSSDFPVVSGAYSGGADAFVIEVALDLGTLISGTYLGGSGYDYGFGVGVGTDGVYVVGATSSSDFPVTSGAYSNTRNGWLDGFVSRFSLDLSSLIASTYLGGGSTDYVYSAVAVSDGVYVAGYTSSSDFPVTAGAYDGTFGGSVDVFVAKMDGSLGSVLTSTFIGGSGSEYAYDMKLSSDGVYVYGNTASRDFPTTAGAFSTLFSGGLTDGFISVLSLDLSTLRISTYIGGAGDDYVESILLTPGGIYVAGHSGSRDFPVTPGEFDDSFAGSVDGFIVLMDANLSSMSGGTFLDSAYVAASSIDILYDVFYYDGFLYAVGSSEGYMPLSGYRASPSGKKDVVVLKIDVNTFDIVAGTFLGGSGDDEGYSVYVTPGGVYLAGRTTSSDFPVVGGYDASLGGTEDGFVARMSLDLSSLLSSSYLGGGSTDRINDMCGTSDGIYVVGTTYSSDFPVTAGAFDNSFNGFYDAFISRFNLELSSLLSSTFLGGSGYDEIKSIACASDGVYTIGHTGSSDFPVTAGAYRTSFSGGYDVFVSKLSLDLSSLPASTYLGGGSWEYSSDISLSSLGVYVSGYTYSTDFPTTPGAYSTSYAGSQDIFLSLLSSDLSSLSASTYLGGAGTDYSSALYIAPDGVYIAGYTYSSDFPVSPGAIDGTYNGGKDAVVSRFSFDLSSLSASTYMGGSGDDEAYSITMSPNLLYIAGNTTSRDFPITLDAGYPRGGVDMLLFSLEPGLTPVDAPEGSSGGERVFWRGDRLVIYTGSRAYVGYDIYDVSGRLLDRVSLGLYPPGRLEIPLVGYGPGVYIVKVRVGEEVESFRVLLK